MLTQLKIQNHQEYFASVAHHLQDQFEGQSLKYVLDHILDNVYDQVSDPNEEQVWWQVQDHVQDLLLEAYYLF